MTGAATYLLVPTLKRVFGILVMIEPDFFPILLTMAILAFLAVAASVYIIDTMAAITLFRDILITFVRVTACARNLLMRVP